MSDYRIGAPMAEALSEARADVGRATFYTGSSTDLPMARLAARTVPVRAGRRTVARSTRVGFHATLWG